MSLKVEDLDDNTRFRLFLTIPYTNLIDFVFEYLRKRSRLTSFFWLTCSLFLCLAILLRLELSGHYPHIRILLHSATGMIILPLLCIPFHEMLHVIPYFFFGARDIRFGMDFKQYLFYVTAHRTVATPCQFIVVALTPFVFISVVLIAMIFMLPGLWKWSLSSFLFVHATMCAGDFALMNLYFMNRGKKIYTWDDVEKKEAYFYEKL